MRGERQALSNWRGEVTVRGEVAAGKVLRRAMAAPRADDPRALTHGFHNYPAKLHPHLAETLVGTVPPGATVLDPFCGSGTVLVEATVHGCRALGRDINPLAVRLARFKTAPWAPADLAGLLESLEAIDAHARALLRDRKQTKPPAFARRDFDSHVAWELSGLRDAIRACEKDPRRREAFLLALSSILIKVSRLEGATSDRRFDKNLPPGRTIRWFGARVEEMVEMLRAFSAKVPAGTPPAEVLEGDARRLADVRDGSVDLVVTSPPYAGTYSYAEIAQISGAWLDFQTTRAATLEVGSKGNAGGIPAYRKDMLAALRSVHRVLAPGGRACFVVADLEIGRDILPADQMIEELGRAAGLEAVAVASQRRSVFGRQGVPRVAGGKFEHLVLLRTGGSVPCEPPRATRKKS
ncbi:MAG: hypothetical protein HZA54_00165 [Planctomycetes bacterium]|nr:hypothetical protein [Planctomycetota bacterium]